MSLQLPLCAALAAFCLIAPLALVAAPHAAYAVGTADGYVPIGTTAVPTSELGIYGGATIGTTKPVAILDLSYIRLIPNSVPPAMCDAAHDNVIASTHTHRLCVCVDSRWTDSVQGTACSW